VAKLEQRSRRGASTCAERDAEAGGGVTQYGGFDAERDVGPPSEPARAAGDAHVVEGASMYPRPRPGNLREIAEKIEDATGLRVQIVGGKLVMSPTPRGKHAGVIYELEELIRPQLPSALVAPEVSSIEMPGDPDDFVTPDLLVCPREFLESDDWLLDPRDIELAVEVISQSERSRGIADKTDWYAVAGVPVLLVIDPRNGTWALHNRPDNGAYKDVIPGKFGESLRLPDPLGIEIATDGFLPYGDPPRRAALPPNEPFTGNSQ
jgi:Uma2 family endonuclease